LTKGILALVLLAPLLASCSGGSAGPEERTVDIGTHSLHAVVAGEGAPPVVIDGGIGALSEEYRELVSTLASYTTVVAYDRAGYGPSEPGPLPRDGRRAAQELRTLLEELAIRGPYVLVGHSLGGLNAQIYAALYPDDLAGMILLDPPPLGFIMGQEYPELAAMAEGMTEEWQGIADRGADSESEGERTQAGFFSMLASEHREMFDASARQASSIASFGELPTVVIASGVPNPLFGDVASAYQEYWASESRELAAKSSCGEFVLVEDSTHRLHDDAADLVAETIVSLVRSARE